MSEAPERWLEDSTIDPALRRALEAGRAELPSEAQLASLEARLGPLLGGPGGGGGVDPTGGGALAAKAIGALVIAGALAGGAFWAARDPSAPAPAPAVAPAAEPVSEPPALPEGVDVPEALIEPHVEPALTARPPAPEPAPRFEVDPAAELALIQRAQGTLRSAPAAALALTEEHRRRFGEGSLGQEREVIAIDALSRLDRAAEARARAERFHARWPRSAHGRRVDVIVAE